MAGRIGEDPLVALRAIREALVVPYAALLVDGVPLASSGTETTHTRTLDLDGAGELVVGLRPGDLSFSAGDEQVLRLTVPLLAQTLRARALAEDLIESRGQTIAAVEEERRRLRRELHDGLGPAAVRGGVHLRRGAQPDPHRPGRRRGRWWPSCAPTP